MKKIIFLGAALFFLASVLPAFSDVTLPQTEMKKPKMGPEGMPQPPRPIPFTPPTPRPGVRPDISKPGIPTEDSDGKPATSTYTPSQPSPQYSGGEPVRNVGPAPLIQAGGAVFAAMAMLESEISRDTAFVEGDLTPERMEKLRSRMGNDITYKNGVVKGLEEKGESTLKVPIELIKKTIDAENVIAATASMNVEKRRQAQRLLRANLPTKQEALALIKKEAGR